METIEVAVVRIDDVIPAKNIDFVKIDVQGSEPFVIAGGARTLAAADLIILEWWPYGMARMGSDPQAVTTFLRDHFKRVTIAEGEEGVVPASEAADIVADRLLEMAHREKDHPTRYVDVIAQR